MKLLNKILSILLGLALLGVLITCVYFCFNYAMGLFSRLGQPISFIAGIASVVLLLSSFIIASGMRWAKERESELKLRTEKASLYENILQKWTDVLQPSNNNHQVQSRDSLRHFEQQLLLRASPNVLKAYVALRKLEPEDRLQVNKLQPFVVKMLIEMRKDLGQSIHGLNEDDLMSLFIMSLVSEGANNKISRSLEVKSQPAI